MKLPAAFEDKMKLLLGEEYDDYVACFEEPRYYGLRVNTAKISTEEFRKICPFSIRPISWIENGFYYDGENETPSRHPYYFAGLYYLQEPSAMTPANRLPVEPGDKVLDLCAAPGGKATELGARLCGTGMLAANDISVSRARGLLKNLEVFGIGNALVLSEEPGKLSQHFPEYFDKVLIDAPCSGEGMFRKDRRMIKAWEEHGPEFFSKIQRGIILQAAKLLKPGGMLLYSTCTFDGRENEGTIGYLLDNYPEFTLEEIRPWEGFVPGIPEMSGNVCPQMERTVRIFPHRMHGEGHFLALLRKGDGFAEAKRACGERTAGGRLPKLPHELEDFWKDIDFRLDPGRLDIRGERVFYMPEELPDMRGIRLLRAGLFLGELKKKRFEPSQALAMYLKKEQYRFCIDLRASDERVVRYLKGETLDVSDAAGTKEKGWRLFCVDGYPLGWGRLADGSLKNKYLPGWRWIG